MDDDFLEFKLLNSMLATNFSVTQTIANEHPDVLEQIKLFNPIRSAAVFAGLLTEPSLQPNYFRLEALVHLCVAFGAGEKIPNKADIENVFNSLENGSCGRNEDPSEDLFSRAVYLKKNSFCILEGGSEGDLYYLQRILNVIETMPKDSKFNKILKPIESLLALADVVSKRNNIAPNILGDELKHKLLPQSALEKLDDYRRLTKFEEQDLSDLKISKEDLLPFIFDLTQAENLKSQSPGNLDLEKKPLVEYEGNLYLILPTGISSAIRFFTVSTCTQIGFKKHLEKALVNEYSKLCKNTPFFESTLTSKSEFKSVNGIRLVELMAEVDPGRFLHFIFLIDSLDGIVENGFMAPNLAMLGSAAALSESIENASTRAKENASFCDGITLIIYCGIGRLFLLAPEADPPSSWKVECIPAHDFDALSWIPEIHPLIIWRILETRETLCKLSTSIVNVNGFLNLLAWGFENEGHLVPHATLPSEFANTDTKNLISIKTNSIRALRHKVSSFWSPRKLIDDDGKSIELKRFPISPFGTISDIPLFISETDLQNQQLRWVYFSNNRAWLLSIEPHPDLPSELTFRFGEMFCVWLRRAAPTLEKTLQNLPNGNIKVRVKLPKVTLNPEKLSTPTNLNDLNNFIQTRANKETCTLEIILSSGFEGGFQCEENILEKNLVRHIVAGIAEFSSESLDEENILSLVEKICPGTRARHIHGFAPATYRDLFSERLVQQPVQIDQFDHASARLGLGWRVRDKKEGEIVSGKTHCTSYLNAVVSELIKDICAILKDINRDSLINLALHNYESAAHHRGHWLRTSQANIAVHDDVEQSIKTIIDKENQFGISILSARLIIEAALCECPISGGRSVGMLDLSRLMSLVILVHGFGGWSNAVNLDAMSPSIKISPLGDVQMDQSFIHSVYEPYVRSLDEETLKVSADRYSSLYTPEEVHVSSGELFEDQFLTAWKAEFGISLNCLLNFLKNLEDQGLEQNELIFRTTHSEIISKLSTCAIISSEEASNALSHFILSPREKWQTPPANYKNRDWEPWRFKRRLSLIRRPLIQTNTLDDPTIVVSPELFRDSLSLIITQFYHGEIPEDQIQSKEMRAWRDESTRRRGEPFEDAVRDRLLELGWQARSRVKLPELLGQLDKNYGDIDVLAWSEETGRVMIIECKDLQPRKTVGEVAVQLSDFRGEENSHGKGDDLKKHLDRMDILISKKEMIVKKLQLKQPILLQGHLVFKNPVPMKFAWYHMKDKIQLSLFDQLSQL